MAKKRLKEIREIRIRKIDKLREMGVDPYPSKVDGDPKPIKDALTSEGKGVELAGRVMGWRAHGNTIFADLKDESGQIQLWFQKDSLGDGFDVLKYFDIGDFVFAKGKVTKTKAGEVSVDVEKFQLLTKTIRPLPSTFHGLKDIEERFRKRYLDLIMNPGVKEKFEVRSRVVTAIRELLDNKGFIEVETPTLQPIYGGGLARPFVTHHNALDSDFYLRISDEMYLKRLIVGGFEKVYEITSVFRNEGVDFDHNPEFTMFEAMIAYEDYFYGMDLIEEIFEYSAQKVLGKTEFDYQGEKMNVKRPWKRLRFVEAIGEFTSVDPLSWQSLDQAKEAVMGMGIREDKVTELKKINTIGEVIGFVFEEFVEEKLVQPTIVYDYPVETSPLAKKCDDPRFTQRFEMFAFGSELGNNYTELNDPIDLNKRFIEEKKREQAGFEEAHQTDNDYLEAIEHGFPPTCGIAIGVDRMVMMITDAPNIKEVIAFPTLRPKRLESLKQKLRKPVKVGKLGSLGIISSDVKQAFPGISYAFTVIEGVEIKKASKELESLKRKVVEERKNVSLDQTRDIGSIKVYREMLRKTGIDVGSRRPSPEALLRRVVQGKGLYTINTAVDAYNVAVLETNVGLGGFDFDNIKPPVTLRFSKDGEEMTLLGESKVTKTKKGEIIYADSEKPITLDLNYRDIDETKITLDTKSVILFADGGPGIDASEVKSALELGAKYIQKFCGGEIKDIILVQ